jgi:hypothetical protein
MWIWLDCNIASDKEGIVSRRPLSISIVGWFLSIGGVLLILGSLKLLFLSDDPRVQKAMEGYAIPGNVIVAMEGVVAVTSFVCGVNILNGANWARWLYTISCGCFLIYDIFLFSNHFLLLLPATIVRGVFITFLFLPDANDFFSSR